MFLFRLIVPMFLTNFRPVAFDSGSVSSRPEGVADLPCSGLKFEGAHQERVSPATQVHVVVVVADARKRLAHHLGDV